MILRSLRVEGWRCFANPVEVGPLGDGLNVIHGPNGIGKSTLLLALERAMFDNHAIMGKAVESLRPWGRDLRPTVSIEFEHDGERFRLMKRFLAACCCELSRLEGAQFVRLAEGDAANRQMRAMFGGVAPARGPSDVQHWGLAQVLWAPQHSGLALGELSAGVATAIQAALGAQAAGAGGEALERKVAAAYERVFTSGGNLRRGKDAPPIVGLEKDLIEAQKQRQTLCAKLEEFARRSRRIEDLRSRRDQTDRDQQQLEKTLEQARKRAQSHGDILADRKTQEQAERAAEARYHELQQRIESVKTARQELAAADRELRQLGADAPLQAKEVEQRGLEAELARAALERTRKRRAEVDAADRKAQRATRFLEQRRMSADGEQLLAKIAAAHEQIQSLRTQRSALLAPTAETLHALSQAVKRRDDAQLKLEAALITVSIFAEKDLVVDIVSAEQLGEQTVSPETPCQLMGSPEVVFRVPGVATFRATGPTGSVEPLRRQIDEAAQKIEALAEGFGSTDLDRLRQLHARAEALAHEIGKAETVLSTLLGDRQLADIQQQRLKAVQVIEQLLGQHPEWSAASPDADALRAGADDIRRAFVRDVEQAEADHDRAKDALSLAVQRQNVHAARLKEVEGRAAIMRQRLETLGGDGLEDAAREAQRSRLALEWDAAKARLQAVAEKLAEFPGDPRQEVEILAEQLKQLQQHGQKVAADLHTEQGRLEEVASAAPYSLLAEVEENINRLEEEIARERLGNSAVRLLFTILAECKSEAIGAVVGPVEQRATRTLHRIAGARLGSVAFSERFLPQAVTPRTANEAVKIEELSGGELEQVHFAVRLALAEVLFPEGRQLVVLDDVLTSTDTARLARILAILAEAAEKFQILILTCHPERYHGVPRAGFFDLEVLAAAGA